MYKDYEIKLNAILDKHGVQKVELAEIDNLEKQLNNLRKIREQSYKVGSKFMDLIDDARETFSDVVTEFSKIKKSAKDLGIDYKTLPVNKDYEYEKKKIATLLKNNVKLS